MYNLNFFQEGWVKVFLPLLRRFNPVEPVVEKICNPLED